MEMACQGHDGLLLRVYSWWGDVELRARVSSPSLLAAWRPLTQGGWLGAAHHVSPRTGLRSGLTRGPARFVTPPLRGCRQTGAPKIGSGWSILVLQVKPWCDQEWYGPRGLSGATLQASLGLLLGSQPHGGSQLKPTRAPHGSIS